MTFALSLTVLLVLTFALTITRLLSFSLTFLFPSHDNAPKEKSKAEPILYGWNKGKHYFAESRFEADVWMAKRRAGNTMVHPTQKPLEICGRAIRNSSQRGEIILDLFGGSGSTLISAEKEGRTAYLMELDPKYVDVIVKRWEAFTGRTAVKA